MWLDAWAVEGLLRVAEPALVKSLLPVLRVVASDPERIDRDYAALVRQREPSSWRDSPQRRAKSRFAQFVRELEWACTELRSALPRDQYVVLITGTAAGLLEGWAARWLPSVAELLSAQTPAGRTQATPLRRWLERFLGDPATANLWRRLQPLAFLVGEVDVQHWDPEGGSAVLYIPRCELRAAGAGPRAEETCRRVCKGGVESACGPGAPLTVKLKPARNGSCQARLSWDAPGAVRRSRRPAPGSRVFSERPPSAPPPAWN